MNIIGIGNPEFAYKTLSKMGYRIFYIVSRNQYEKKKFTVGDPLIVVESYSEENIKWIIESICQKHKIKGIINFEEENQYEIQKIIQQLGLTSINLKAVEIANDKFKTRRLIDNLGLDNVPYELVKNKDEITQFYKYVGSPIIVKPISGTGSVNIQLIDSDISLQNFKIDETCIAEQYISGEDYSVECISINGVHHLLGITDKEITGIPYFVERQHVVNGVGVEYKKLIKEKVFKLLDGLQLKDGISHTEIKINKNNLYFVEVHVRPGGDCIMDLVEKSIGLNPYVLLTTLFTEQRKTLEKLIMKISDKPITVGIRYLQHKYGKISSININEEAIKNTKGFFRMYNPYEINTYTHQFKSSFDRDGWIMAYGKNKEEVVATLDSIESLINIEVK